VQSQIVFDGTLGAPGALTGSSITINATSGQQFSGNLFHSFSQFNVNTGQTATFQGPVGISNIISRVTGGSASNIDGTLGSSIANANLFLINPSGVLFGPNASLNVSGSFHASTADYLKLGTTGIFHASNPAASTLSSAPPSAFGFLGSNPAAIRVSDSILAVPTGQTISLVGGDISLEGPVFGALLYAPSGRVNLASAAGPGEISFRTGGIDASVGQALGRIDASNSVIATLSDSNGLASGPVFIRGGNITLSDQSVINANNTSSSPGGGISLAADGEVRISGAFLVGDSGGAGKGGGISITAAQATISDSSFLFTDASASGDAGDITLNVGRLEINAPSLLSAGTQQNSSGAGGLVTLKANDVIFVRGSGAGVITLSEGSGRAGDVIVNAPLVSIEDGAAILTAAISSGAGGTIQIDADRVQLFGGILGSPAVSSTGTSGNVIIRANESVILQDTQSQTAIIGVFTTGNGAAGAISISAPLVRMDGGFLSSGTTAGGSGGTIALDAGRIELLGGGLIESNTSGLGTGGAITLRATESILVQGADAIGTVSAVSSLTNGPGQAGNISVSGPLLTLDGGLLAGPTFSSGNAGTIAIDVGRLEILGGGRINSVTDGGTGGGGLIDVRVRDSILIQGRGADGKPSRIITDTFGPGTAGNILVSAGSLVLDGGLISSSADSGSTGAAGTIQVTAGSVQLASGGRISVQSQGTGNAGSIVIDAGQRLELSGGSSITTEALSADGGDIHISALNMVFLRDSRITTSVGSGAGNGGNITIDPTFVILENSQIIANAFGGNGGNISIVSDVFLKDSASVVQASSQLGISGTVLISAPQSNLGSGLAVLPSAFFDASALMRESCAARAGRSANSFVPAGRGGLAAQPDRLAFSDYRGLGAGGSVPKADALPAPSFWLASSGCAPTVP
jgi:filamentous hemagglutinin family protein